MATLLTILTTVGTWLLKQFLAGVLGTIEAHFEDHAQSQVDAANLKTQTVQEGAALETAVVKQQYAQQAQAAQDAAARPADDPFGVTKWNASKK
jgi:hypothetical protein